MTLVLTTGRLKLREFSEDDLDVLAAMVGGEDQMRFYPRPRTRAEASAWINRNISLYKIHGFGFWCIESLQTSEFLGYCGIRPLCLEGTPEIELGWHVRKRVWNQGIATEAARGARKLAVSRFGLSRLVAVIHPDNLASRRVAANIGMHAEKTTIFGDDRAVIHALELGS